jgi:hypothetical protein
MTMMPGSSFSTDPRLSRYSAGLFLINRLSIRKDLHPAEVPKNELQADHDAAALLLSRTVSLAALVRRFAAPALVVGLSQKNGES